jgi:hypothetical protein
VIDSRKDQNIFPNFTESRPTLGPIQLPIQCVLGVFIPGVNRPGRAHHSPPSSPEVKNSGAIPQLPLMSSWPNALLIKHGDFTFYLKSAHDQLLPHQSGRHIVWVGRAIAQPVSCRLPTSAARLEPRSGHVGFVLDKVALRLIFSEYFGLPCQFSFYRLLHTHHVSSGVGTTDQ